MPIQAPTSTTQRLVPMLAVSDIEKAMLLYRDLLGFTITDKFAKDGSLIWCMARAGSSEVMFQRHARQAEKNGGTVFWIYVSEIDGVREQLVAEGYSVTMPETADGRRECEFVDRDDNLIMLCQIVNG